MPAGDPQALGAAVRSFRRRAGFSLRALALLCDLSPSIVSNIENGLVQDPGVFTIAAIADALDVSIARLLDG